MKRLTMTLCVLLVGLPACDGTVTPWKADLGVGREMGPGLDRGAPRKDGGPVDGAPRADAAAISPDGSDPPWVRITAPKNNARVTNPVTFKIAAHKVAMVQLWAEKSFALTQKWDPRSKRSVTHHFTYTNTRRTVTLKGYGVGGKELARDRVSFTFGGGSSGDPGTLLGSMWITYYYLVQESAYSGSATYHLLDSHCKTIARVSKRFYDALCIEGSGKLKDGRVVNYESTCSCAARCAYGSRTCYKVLNKTRYPWGAGAAGRSLVPLRSWAVDRNKIAIGTVLYARQWDGVAIPRVGSLGGFTHDGCFRADDVGGAIKGMHYDFFAGSKAMAARLNKGKTVTRSTFTVYRDGKKCAYLKP